MISDSQRKVSIKLWNYFLKTTPQQAASADSMQAVQLSMLLAASNSQQLSGLFDSWSLTTSTVRSHPLSKVSVCACLSLAPSCSSSSLGVRVLPTFVNSQLEGKFITLSVTVIAIHSRERQKLHSRSGTNCQSTLSTKGNPGHQCIPAVPHRVLLWSLLNWRMCFSFLLGQFWSFLSFFDNCKNEQMNLREEEWRKRKGKVGR